MAVKEIDFTDCYTPKTEDKQNSISVDIGDGQTGSYSIFLGTSLVTTNTTASLGTKKNMLGKAVTISVTVVDTLQETNWTSMTVRLKEEGQEEKVYGPYRHLAEAHLDTVVFVLKLIVQ